MSAVGQLVDQSVDPVVLSRRLAYKGFQLLTAKLGRILYLVMMSVMMVVVVMMMMLMVVVVVMMRMMMRMVVMWLFSLELVEQWLMGIRLPAGKKN